MNTLNFSIITPNKTVVEDEIDFLLVRTLEGDIGIYPEHENTLLILEDGPIEFHKDEDSFDYMIEGGFLIVGSGKALLLAEFASLPEDVERLKEEYLQRLEEVYMKEMQSELGIQRAELALHRSLIYGKDLNDNIYYHEED